MLSSTGFKQDAELEKQNAYIRMDKDEEGYNKLTEGYIRELCENMGQFENPKRNDCLFLHYKGFRHI